MPFNLPRPTDRYDSQNETATRSAIAIELAALRELVNGLAAGGYTKVEEDARFLKLAGGVMTGNITLGTGGSVFEKSVTYPGMGVALKASGLIADSGVLDIGGADMLGIALIIDNTAAAALAVLGASIADTTVSAIRGTWSKTINTASSTNVYWNAASSTYRIQNKTGSGRVYNIVRFGGAMTM